MSQWLLPLLLAAGLCAQTPSPPPPSQERVAPPGYSTVASTLQVYVSPKNNQSQEQQLKDETECYKWARGQSAVPEQQEDVSNAANGASSKIPIPVTENVRRAYSVCMISHNYTIQ